MMDDSTNRKPYLSNHHYTLEYNLAAIWLKVKNNNVIMEYIALCTKNVFFRPVIDVCQNRTHAHSRRKESATYNLSAT